MITTLLTIIMSFGKIGFVSLGGGNSMLKLLEYETVTVRHWINQEEFIRMVGSTFLFPGLTVIKLTALISYKIAGILGLLCAIICLNLPGLLLALIGYRWLTAHNTPLTQNLLTAVQYGALALLAAATYSIAESVINQHYSVPMIVACMLFFCALAFFKLSPFLGLLGFISIGLILLR